MLKKIILCFCTLLPFLSGNIYSIGMDGSRNSTPAYIRTPRIDPSTYALPTQQATTRSTMPNSQMIMAPHLQSNQSTLAQQQQQEKERLYREREIGSYTHMYGTSDTYGGYEIR